jgi:hypothetical protein
MYFMMKLAAVQRHLILKWIEGDDRPLSQTWHGAVIDLVYPY